MSTSRGGTISMRFGSDGTSRQASFSCSRGSSTTSSIRRRRSNWRTEDLLIEPDLTGLRLACPPRDNSAPVRSLNARQGVDY